MIGIPHAEPLNEASEIRVAHKNIQNMKVFIFPSLHEQRGIILGHVKNNWDAAQLADQYGRQCQGKISHDHRMYLIFPDDSPHFINPQWIKKGWKRNVVVQCPVLKRPQTTNVNAIMK